jgi:hypothetical protein
MMAASHKLEVDIDKYLEFQAIEEEYRKYMRLCSA